MSYIRWYELKTQSRRYLDWDMCETLFRNRGYKRKVDRSPMDTDRRLNYKCIANYTYLSFDNKRNCWVVFSKWWGKARWRKIIEVHRNNRWRIFTDLDKLYNDRDYLPNVESVMNLSDEDFEKDTTSLSYSCRLRINEMTPAYLYYKRTSGWSVNNKHLPFKNGMTVDLQTALVFPKWWKVAPYRWLRNRQLEEERLISSQTECIVNDINSYVSKFIAYAYKDAHLSSYVSKVEFVETCQTPKKCIPPRHDAWIDNLKVNQEYEVGVTSNGYNTAVSSATLTEKNPDIALLANLIRAKVLDDPFAVKSVCTIESHEGIFPMYLLFKAFRHMSILPENYIAEFLEDFQSMDPGALPSLTLRCNIDIKNNPKTQLAKEMLTNYLLKFHSRFLIIYNGMDIIDTTSDLTPRCPTYQPHVNTPSMLAPAGVFQDN